MKLFVFCIILFSHGTVAALVAGVSSAVGQVSGGQTVDGTLRQVASQDGLAGVRIIMTNTRQPAIPTPGQPRASVQFDGPGPAGAGPVALQSGEAAATTDGNGRFSLKNIEPGVYVLRTEGDVRFAPMNVRLTVRSGQDVKNLILAVVPTGVITGRVRDKDGLVSGALIEAFRISNVGGENVLTVLETGESDDRGVYRLHSLQPGRYYVRVSRPGSNKILSTYAPSAGTVADATVIDLTQGGERTGIDIAVREGKLVQVSGRVEPVPGESTLRISLYLEPRNRNTIPPVNTSAVPNLSSSPTDFQLVGVEPGNYNLFAIVRLASGGTRSGRVPLDVGDRDVQGVNIPLNSAVTVKGQIEVKGGALPQTPMRVALRPIGNRPYTLLQLTSQSASGRFEFSNVPPGDYVVQLTRQNPAMFVADMSSDGRSIYDNAMITVKDQSEQLQVTVGLNGGQVVGTVSSVSQGGFAGVGVWLVPSLETRTGQEFTRGATPDADGRFSISGIPPGEYKLVAIERSDLESPADIASKFRQQGTTLRIGENTAVTVDPVLIKRQ